MTTHSIEQLVDGTLGSNHHHLSQPYSPSIFNLLPQPNPPNQPQHIDIPRHQDSAQESQKRRNRRRIDPPGIKHALFEDDVRMLCHDGEAPGGEDDERGDKDNGRAEAADFDQGF